MSLCLSAAVNLGFMFVGAKVTHSYLAKEGDRSADAFLQTVTQLYRKDLLVGSARTVRLSLQGLLDRGVISGYQISSAELRDESVAFTGRIVSEGESLFTKEIKFSDNGPIWGTITYLVPKQTLLSAAQGQSRVYILFSFFALLFTMLPIVATYFLAIRTTSSLPEVLKEIADTGNIPNGLSNIETRLWQPTLTKFSMLATQVREARRNEIVSIVAAQVAHDIRSPLAALEMIAQKTIALPEDERIMVRNAVGRIRDIANDLLQKNRAQKMGIVAQSAREPKSPQLLSSLVEMLVTEKRMQYRSKIGIQIETDMAPGSYGLFSEIQPIEFKRVISNLINNSVEALGDRGNVYVHLIQEGAFVILRVRDDGKGISPEVLAKLGQKGETHGKEGGSGLGLFHAQESVKFWHGTLELTSELGHGTTATIRLPAASAPEWFIKELRLSPSTHVVVLDDDSSIHQVWRGRFESAQNLSEPSRITLHNISNPEAFREWCVLNAALEPKIFLCDYELLGHSMSGLDLIEEQKIGDQSVLVTSRFEEPQIRDRCFKQGIKLIPKTLAGFVPIKICKHPERRDAIIIDPGRLVSHSVSTGTSEVIQSATKRRYDLCLIDDDTALIHPVWAAMAKAKGLSIRLFSNPQEFLAAASSIDLSTPIYIDVSLGPNVSGVDFSHEVFKLGFTEINLATGYEPEAIKAPSFVRRITGKDFPDIAR